MAKGKGELQRVQVSRRGSVDKRGVARRPTKTTVRKRVGGGGSPTDTAALKGGLHDLAGGGGATSSVRVIGGDVGDAKGYTYEDARRAKNWRWSEESDFAEKMEAIEGETIGQEHARIRDEARWASLTAHRMGKSFKEKWGFWLSEYEENPDGFRIESRECIEDMAYQKELELRSETLSRLENLDEDELSHFKNMSPEQYRSLAGKET